MTANPNLDILGNPDARRLSIASFRVRHGARFLHHNFVVALLNDLFGIQARGGCSCAGPYGHRLLGIDAEGSRAFQDEILLGSDGIKPGWVRLGFNYFISDTVRDYLTDAVDLLGGYGHRLLTDYRFDPHTGLWHHRTGPARPALRLGPHLFGDDGVFGDAGPFADPPRHQHAGEDALAGYLREARELLSARADDYGDEADGLPPEFEALRWFPLPRVSLADPVGAVRGPAR